MKYPLIPYAFVDRYGEWHSVGDMGWFGISSGEKDKAEWAEEVHNIYEEIRDEDYIVVVDCHI